MEDAEAICTMRAECAELVTHPASNAMVLLISTAIIAHWAITPTMANAKVAVLLGSYHWPMELVAVNFLALTVRGRRLSV